jgi:hypothetical protein
VSQIFSDFAAALCIQQQHLSALCGNLFLPIKFLVATGMTSQFKLLYYTAHCRSCWCLSHVRFSMELPSLSQKYCFGKMFWQKTHFSMMFTILHSAYCLLGCKLLTFFHPLVPPFYFFPLVIP